MKKLKALKGALIGIFVVAAACCVFVACGSSDDDEEEKNEAAVQSSPISVMALSVDNAKRTYLTYQSFSAEGIEATVTRESGETEEVVANDLVVDYSEFDNSMAGEYDIVVSYTEDGVTLSDSYKVEVIEEIVGMTIVKEKIDYAVNDYDVETGSSGDVGEVKDVEDAEIAYPTIDLSDMKVYAVDGDGVSTEEMDGGEYELKYYKDGEQIFSLENLELGIYTIYAYRDVTIVGKYSTINYECGAYVICYVYDEISEFALNETDTNAVFAQGVSRNDLITSTWTYTVTYRSGVVKTLTADEVSVVGISTSKEGEKTTTATYTERIKNSTTDQTKTHSISISYRIEGAADDMYGLKEIYNFNDMEYSSDFSGGEIIFDAFTVAGGVKVSTDSTNWNDMPGELEGLTLSKWVQLDSSKKLNFSMLLPGTVTVYGYAGASDATSVTMYLNAADSSDTNTTATLVTDDGTGTEATFADRTGNWEDNCLSWHCTAGDFTLSASASANIWVIVVEYDEKTENDANETAELTTLEAIEMGNIDLSLPENSVASFGEGGSRKK